MAILNNMGVECVYNAATKVAATLPVINNLATYLLPLLCYQIVNVN